MKKIDINISFKIFNIPLKTLLELTRLVMIGPVLEEEYARCVSTKFRKLNGPRAVGISSVCSLFGLRNDPEKIPVAHIAISYTLKRRNMDP